MKITFLILLVISLFNTNIFAAGKDDPLLYKFNAEKLEMKMTTDNPIDWDIDFFIGKDLNKVYFFSEGSSTKSNFDETENALVYSRAISSFWDYQIGLAYDTTQTEEELWFITGFQGLAPYFFETKIDLLINDDKNMGLRVDIDYDFLFTQQVILTPSLETSFYSKNNEKMELGSGLSSTKLGLRLRYEVVREFAPYIGITWNKTYGNTKVFEDVDETKMIVGFKFWF